MAISKLNLRGSDPTDAKFGCELIFVQIKSWNLTCLTIRVGVNTNTIIQT